MRVEHARRSARTLGVTRQRAAEGVADEAFGRVVPNDLPVGEPLGARARSATGVSWAVLREAVRLLEHRSIASVRRGPGGGLFVSEPRLATASDAVLRPNICRNIGSTAEGVGFGKRPGQG